MLIICKTQNKYLELTNPIGISPTRTTLCEGPRSRTNESIVPTTTAISSKGTGNRHFLSIHGLMNSFAVIMNTRTTNATCIVTIFDVFIFRITSRMV